MSWNPTDSYSEARTKQNLYTYVWKPSMEHSHSTAGLLDSVANLTRLHFFVSHISAFQTAHYKKKQRKVTSTLLYMQSFSVWSSKKEGVAVISAKNHKRQRRKRQSITAKREKSQTPKVLTAILTLPNLT